MSDKASSPSERIQTGVCRCGLLLVRNDARQKLSHESPVCDWFREVVARAGPGDEVDRFVESAEDVLRPERRTKS